jgi:hypothetical protein
MMFFSIIPSPPILQFNLTSKTKHIELFLRRKSLKAAVPYYTQVYDEIVKHTPANEKVSKYIINGKKPIIFD